jgi:hypothetical protein
VPESRKSFCHTRLVKIGSRSLTIEDGRPWSRTTCWKNAAATEVAEYGWPRAMKCAYLDRRSITVKITDLPNLGKAFHKIHGDVGPDSIGDGKWLQQPWWVEVVIEPPQK